MSPFKLPFHLDGFGGPWSELEGVWVKLGGLAGRFNQIFAKLASLATYLVKLRSGYTHIPRRGGGFCAK
eukprot:1550362-Karenia_brevis.AAC.1